MTDREKRNLLLFLLFTTIAIGLIASALPRLVLNPGVPLPRIETSGQIPSSNSELLIQFYGLNFLKALLALIAVLSFAYSIYQAFRSISWKAFVHNLFAIVPLIFMLLCTLVILLFGLKGQRRPNSPELDILIPEISAAGPPLGPLPSWLIWVVWICFVATIILLAYWMISGRAKQTSAGYSVLAEAELALNCLKTGFDFKSVIIRCYEQMSFAIKIEQGIEKEDAMTAREFEQLLVAKGIPRAPIQQLTRLFETARYGNRPSLPIDEQAASDCLQTIVRSCRREQPAE